MAFSENLDFKVLLVQIERQKLGCPHLLLLSFSYPFILILWKISELSWAKILMAEMSHNTKVFFSENEIR